MGQKAESWRSGHGTVIARALTDRLVYAREGEVNRRFVPRRRKG